MSKDPNDSQLMNLLVRMVIPMRREFGRQLDVQHFLHDRSYARSVIEEALTSQNDQLREHARYIAGRLHGARIADAPAAPRAPAPPAPGAAPAASPAPAAAAPAPATAEELRARMMKKYTTGLR